MQSYLCDHVLQKIYKVSIKILYINIYITPVLVATEECLLGILPMSTRCKMVGR